MTNLLLQGSQHKHSFIKSFPPESRHQLGGQHQVRRSHSGDMVPGQDPPGLQVQLVEQTQGQPREIINLIWLENTTDELENVGMSGHGDWDWLTGLLME